MPRRLAITGPHKVEVLEYEDPPLEDNQVLVETELASGKHGTTVAGFDAVNWSGQRFDQEMRLFIETGESAEAAQPSRDAPRRTGTTGLGVVAGIGPEVTRWKVGDRVFGFMDVRETNVCGEERLWEVGDLDPLLALCVEPAYVSFHCIRESNVRYGDTVAVVGLGALGLLAVCMAREAGAEAVFAVDPLPGRRQWAAENGADHVFDPSEGDAALEIHRLTGGLGVDVAIELAGSYPALYTAIRCVRVGATVCSAGFYQGDAHDLWLGRGWHHNRLTMIVPHGCGWGHPPRDYPMWDERRAYDCIVSMMRKGRLAAPGLIDPVVPLEEGPEVFRLIEEEPDKVIKYGVRF
ncbi:MAG: zinc-binding alcohol dehydrogenase [Armatimonadota bacterium]|jgi:threonine dehydrogenase-like Zn-dependent dehydrogenase